MCVVLRRDGHLPDAAGEVLHFIKRAGIEDAAVVKHTDENHFAAIENLLDFVVLQHSRVPFGQYGFDGVVDLHPAGLPAEKDRDSCNEADDGPGIIENRLVEAHHFIH